MRPYGRIKHVTGGNNWKWYDNRNKIQRWR